MSCKNDSKFLIEYSNGTNSMNKLACPDERIVHTTRNNGNNERRWLAGVTLSILSALCFSITAVLVKKMVHVNACQLALFRYIGNKCFFLFSCFSSLICWYNR